MRGESKNPKCGLIRTQVKAAEVGSRRRTWIDGSKVHCRISPAIPAPSLPGFPLPESRQRIPGPLVGREGHGGLQWPGDLAATAWDKVSPAMTTAQAGTALLPALTLPLYSPHSLAPLGQGAWGCRQDWSPRGNPLSSAHRHADTQAGRWEGGSRSGPH